VVEHQLPKLSVEGSIPFARSKSLLSGPETLVTDYARDGRRRPLAEAGLPVLSTRNGLALTPNSASILSRVCCEQAAGRALSELQPLNRLARVTASTDRIVKTHALCRE
jgi:hypothetical protein